jgi:LacI family transcriptional regulator
VSNVLNDPLVVSETTRDRVLEAIRDTGFVRNTAARQLRGARSKVVGVVVLDSSNPFFMEMIRGAEDTLRPEGYVLISCSTDESFEREAMYLRLLEEHRVDGILITPATSSISHLEAFLPSEISVVLVDRRAEGGEFCSVTVDDVRGGEIAVDYLVESGHRKIAFINGPESIRQCHDRREGVLRSIGRAQSGSLGDTVALKELYVSSLTIGAGETAARAMIEDRYDVTAVLCANDLVAIGVLREYLALGIEVPKQFSLVGYDDITFSAMLSPSLTSVHQPQYELGATAAQLLLDELKDPHGHTHREVNFTPTLRIRESSAER